MADSQTFPIDPKRTKARHAQLPSGAEARRRLLAGLPVRERTLRLADVSTAVLEGGNGSSIILLHGPGEYGAKWLRVMPTLIETHHLIAPDLPGHGDSEVPAGPLDSAFMLRWIDALIDATCRTAPVLIGQILGGAIAAKYAVRYGDRLRKLVLVDSLGLAPFQPVPEFGAALTAFISEPTEDTHDRLWKYCAHNIDDLRDHLGEKWDWIKGYNLDRARSPVVQAAQQGLMHEFGISPIPQTDLARIDVPVDMIWGRYDLATPLPVAEAVSARHGWPLHVIESSGDDAPLEQPESFVETLRRIMDSPDKGGSLGQ